MGTASKIELVSRYYLFSRYSAACYVSALEDSYAMTRLRQVGSGN